MPSTRDIELYMLAYNRREYTDITLRSFSTVRCGIPWTRIRFTIINQASVDGTRELLAAWKPPKGLEVLVHHRTANLGCPGGMELYRSQLMGTAPYVGKIDNDSIFTEDWLLKLLRALEAFPKLGLVGAAQSTTIAAGVKVERQGTGYYVRSQIGGRFLARREIFNVGVIKPTKGKLFGWQPYQKKIRNAGWAIGWCCPHALIEHIGDRNMRHPAAIRNQVYRKYMTEVGRKPVPTVRPAASPAS